MKTRYQQVWGHKYLINGEMITEFSPDSVTRLSDTVYFSDTGEFLISEYDPWFNIVLINVWEFYDQLELTHDRVKVIIDSVDRSCINYLEGLRK